MVYTFLSYSTINDSGLGLSTFCPPLSRGYQVTDQTDDCHSEDFHLPTPLLIPAKSQATLYQSGNVEVWLLIGGNKHKAAKPRTGSYAR